MTTARRRLIVASLTALALSLPSCRMTSRADGVAAAPATTALDLTSIDTSCAPCSDFFGYANGLWLKQAVTAPDRSSGWSIVTNERVVAQVTAIVDSAAAATESGRAGPGTDLHSIGTYFNACMDTAAIEARGVPALAETLRRIDAVNSLPTLMRLMGELHHSDEVWIVAVGPAPDQRDPRRTIPVVAFLGGLGLGDRENYLRDDARSRMQRSNYQAYVNEMFSLSGAEDSVARIAAQTVLRVETELARRHLDLASARDPRNTDNVIPLGELARLTPGIPWTPFLEGARVPATAVINARYPRTLVALDSLLNEIPLEDWKILFRWKIVGASITALPARFRTAQQNFVKLQTGRSRNDSRRSACLEDTRRAAGDLVGRLYVERHFSAEARDRARQFAGTMVDALRERLGTLEWMSEPTRREALAKLDSMDIKIGYPDAWRDHSGLAFASGEYLQNRRSALAFRRQQSWRPMMVARDRREWRDSPLGGEFYFPSFNDVHFGARSLQPPQFDPRGDDAVNYGAAGAILAHEISHGFDVIGRQFDAAGVNRDWWAPVDEAEYQRRTARLVEQFNAYPLDSTRFVNGRTSLTENVADLAGVKLAYLALQRSLKGKPRRTIAGLTPEQRFFLAYAQQFRAVSQLPAGPGFHSPAKWRVNGPLSNLEEFARAWGCRRGEPMVRADSLRVTIW